MIIAKSQIIDPIKILVICLLIGSGLLRLYRLENANIKMRAVVAATAICKYSLYSGNVEG